MADANEYVGKLVTLLRGTGAPSLGSGTVEKDDNGPYIRSDGRKRRIRPGDRLSFYNSEIDRHMVVNVD